MSHFGPQCLVSFAAGRYLLKILLQDIVSGVCPNGLGRLLVVYSVSHAETQFPVRRRSLRTRPATSLCSLHAAKYEPAHFVYCLPAGDAIECILSVALGNIISEGLGNCVADFDAISDHLDKRLLATLAHV